MDKTNTAYGLEKVAKRGKGCNLQNNPHFSSILVCLVLFFYFHKKIAIRWSRVPGPIWPFAGFVHGHPELIDLYLQPQKI